MEFLGEQHGPDCKVTTWRHPMLGILRVWTDHPRFGGGADVIRLWEAIDHAKGIISRREARKSQPRAPRKGIGGSKPAA